MFEALNDAKERYENGLITYLQYVCDILLIIQRYRNQTLETIPVAKPLTDEEKTASLVRVTISEFYEDILKKYLTVA
jgi:hypothetical protein